VEDEMPIKGESVTFTRTDPPEWLLAFWREIDRKTFGKGFDCFADDAVCNLGVADWHGREAIRENLRKFIDTGFTAHHEVLDVASSSRTDHAAENARRRADLVQLGTADPTRLLLQAISSSDDRTRIPPTCRDQVSASEW
jgi:hypothetical protein